MKAIYLQEPGRFEQVDLPDPDGPGAGDALVRVHRVGICGTDLHAYQGSQLYYTYPRIPGHELGVEVVEVGAGVKHIEPGDTCAVEPYMNCRRCLACRQDRGNCCAKLEVIGVHRDGGMRPLFVVRADKLHKAESLSFDQLALVETLAIGCHAVNRAAVKAGEQVMVIGAGPIGLGVIQFCRLAGAEVIVLDLNEKRLGFCSERMGIRHTLKPGEQTVGQLANLTGGDMPAVVFDVTGNFRSMSGAIQYLAHGGRLVFVGIVKDELAIAGPAIHGREATILGSRNAHAREFAFIIDRIRQGKIDTTCWITHRTDFEHLPGDFPSYVDPATGVIKAMVNVAS